MSEATTTARVRLMLDIEIPDNWGDECKVEQIRVQATERALGILRNGVIVNGERSSLRSDVTEYAHVVGSPEVTAILLPAGRKRPPYEVALQEEDMARDRTRLAAARTRVAALEGAVKDALEILRQTEHPLADEWIPKLVQRLSPKHEP